MRLGLTLTLTAAAISFAAASSRPAFASPGEGDGAYGRLDGDFSVVLGLGASVLPATNRAAGHAEVRGRYLDAAGIGFTYDEGDAFARATETGDLRRTFGAVVEIRPLFPARFLTGHESHAHGFGNLVLDSFGIEVGTFVAARASNAVRRAGFSFGVALELPLFGKANGLWLRLAPTVRWSPERLEGADGAQDPGGRAVMLTFSLAWHQFLSTHLVDKGDEHIR